MLTELRDAAREFKFCDKLVAVGVAAYLLMLMPYLHIGIIYLKFWVPGKPEVNKQNCSCSCFDTVFKGSYEMPGRESYKNLYFNSNANTLKIWIITIIFIILFYESVKYLVSVYRTSRLRKIWFLLYLINLYPHYYSWWNIIGYYNEEFHTLLPQQIYFSLTEIFSSVAVVYLCDVKHKIKVIFLQLILAINIVHVIVSGSDQFVAHIIQGQGTSFQNARDLGLMVPDVLHLLIPGMELCRREVQPSGRGCMKDIAVFTLLVAMGTVIGKLL